MARRPNGPQHAGSRPGHAFEYLAAVQAVIALCHRHVSRNEFAFTQTRLIMTTIYSRTEQHHKEVIDTHPLGEYLFPENRLTLVS